MESIIPHNYLIHPTGIILYLKSIYEYTTCYEFIYKVVYISEQGLSHLFWSDFHSNNLNLDNSVLLNQTFVLKVRISKSTLSMKSASFKSFFRRCIKIKSDKLDLVFKPEEKCGLPYVWKKNVSLRS